jgi:hypothetical protein
MSSKRSNSIPAIWKTASERGGAAPRLSPPCNTGAAKARFAYISADLSAEIRYAIAIRGRAIPTDSLGAQRQEARMTTIRQSIRFSPLARIPQARMPSACEGHRYPD